MLTKKAREETVMGMENGIFHPHDAAVSVASA